MNIQDHTEKPSPFSLMCVSFVSVTQCNSNLSKFSPALQVWLNCLLTIAYFWPSPNALLRLSRRGRVSPLRLAHFYCSRQDSCTSKILCSPLTYFTVKELCGMQSVISKYRRYNWVAVTFVVMLHMTDHSLSNHSSLFVPSSSTLGEALLYGWWYANFWHIT